MVYAVKFKFKFKCSRQLNLINSFDISNVVCLLFLLFVAVTQCCTNLKRESKIKIEKNGYVDIVVGIEEGVREDLLLIERIKETFTEASQLLFNITK